MTLNTYSNAYSEIFNNFVVCLMIFRYSKTRYVTLIVASFEFDLQSCDNKIFYGNFGTRNNFAGASLSERHSVIITPSKRIE